MRYRASSVSKQRGQEPQRDVQPCAGRRGLREGGREEGKKEGREGGREEGDEKVLLFSPSHREGKEQG